jgi:hypothetical protein
MNIDDIGEGLAVAVTFLVVILIVAIIIAFPTMWLWNWLMPVIFGLPEISVWQALGLNILSGILFRSNIRSSSK